MFLRISKTMSALVVTLFFLDALPSGAELSAACTQENAVLSATSNLQSILIEYGQEYKQKFAYLCGARVTRSTTCTIDLNTLSATADYKATCLSAGGQVFISDATQVCSNNGLTLTINSNNQVLCAGQSCNKNDVEAENDKSLDALDLSNVANLGGGAKCSSNTEIEGSTGNDASGAMLITAAVMVVVMSRLLVLSQIL